MKSVVNLNSPERAPFVERWKKTRIAFLEAQHAAKIHPVTATALNRAWTAIGEATKALESAEKTYRVSELWKEHAEAQEALNAFDSAGDPK